MDNRGYIIANPPSPQKKSG